MGTPRLEGWVGRGVDTVQVWYLSLWRRTMAESFLLGQTCPIALGVGGIIGSGMYPLTVSHLRAPLIESGCPP